VKQRYDPHRHHRRSTRLRGWDYSQAATYFVTICTDQRQCLFGEVVDGRMLLNDPRQTRPPTTEATYDKWAD